MVGEVAVGGACDGAVVEAAQLCCQQAVAPLHTQPGQPPQASSTPTCRILEICEARRPTTWPLASTTRNRSPSRDFTPCSSSRVGQVKAAVAAAVAAAAVAPAALRVAQRRSALARSSARLSAMPLLKAAGAQVLLCLKAAADPTQALRGRPLADGINWPRTVSADGWQALGGCVEERRGTSGGDASSHGL